MTHRYLKMNFRNALLALVLAMACNAALAQTPAQIQARKDRVYVRDLEGFWLNEAYVKVLSGNRSPHASAKRVAPLLIGLRREGRSYPIVITDFNKAVLNVVLDVEPQEKAGTYRLVLAPEDRPVSSSEVTFLPFEGAKNAQGKFDRLRFSDPFLMKGKPSDFMLLAGEVSPYINRLVIAGTYKDEKGATWTFTEAGEARWPDRTFRYDLSMNDPTANCDYLQTEDLKDGDQNLRFGYAWKADKLSIFPARVAGKRVRCEARPIAVLTRQ